MLTETQSLLIRTVTPPTLISIGLYILIYPKLSKKQISLIYIVFLISFLIASFYYLPFALVPVVFIFAYLYHIRKDTPIVLFMLPVAYLLLVLCDNTISLILFKIFQAGYDTLNYSVPHLLIYDFTEYTTYFIALYLVSTLLQKFLYRQAVSLPKGTLWTLLANLILCCIIVITNILAGDKIGYNSTNVLFNCMNAVVFFLVSAIIIYQCLKVNQRYYKAQEELKQYESLKEYTSNLEQVYNNLRSFKHDYVNIMTSISSYLDEKKYDELFDFYHTNLVPLKNELVQNTESLHHLMHVKPLEIKSLLSYKMMYAIEKNISVTIDIPNDITKICMNPIDLTRLLGIYLDNAIEAALESQHPNVNLHLADIDGYVAFIISNSYLDKGLSLAEMTKLHTTTKKNGHGIGLHNASLIFKKYPSVFHETYIENNLFFQHMQIPNN